MLLELVAILKFTRRIFGLDTGLSVAAIVLTFAEAFRLATRSLSPALFLLSNIIKLALFIVLIGLDGDGIRRGIDRHRVGGIAAFVLDVMAMLVLPCCTIRIHLLTETSE